LNESVGLVSSLGKCAEH